MAKGLTRYGYVILKALALAPQHTEGLRELRRRTQPMISATYSRNLERLVSLGFVTIHLKSATLTDKGKARILMPVTTKPVVRKKPPRPPSVLDMLDLRIAQAIETSNRHHDAGEDSQATHWAGVASGYTEAYEMIRDNLTDLLEKKRSGSLKVTDFPMLETR